MSQANFFPSKSFFVSTLTRDIELKDAILDLLDNCIDGIIRIQEKKKSEDTEGINKDDPYSDFWAKIEVSERKFSIHDNCGGISRKIAEESAFRLGRIDNEVDKGLHTIGMYGIGMKRAIFKMGRHAIVSSVNGSDRYVVEITPEWLDDDQSWGIDIIDKTIERDYDGTHVEVTDLHANIGNKLKSADFVRELIADISSFFAIIIKKGFSVYVNNTLVEPASIDILGPSSLSKKKKSDSSIEPYAFKGSVNGVNINLVVGFYRTLANTAEVEEVLDADEDHPQRKSNNAGWTVICNDRIILYRDKTRVTGWGQRDVPQYHTQFIAISGVVIFDGDDSAKLPLGTTKRTLDTSSEVYLIALNYMMDGLKQFTSFTNLYKGKEEETNDDFKFMRPMSPSAIISYYESSRRMNAVRANIKGTTATKVALNLPKPKNEERDKRIMFYKPQSEIEQVAQHLFGSIEINAGQVGQECFEMILRESK
ncbi:ATP-binding protein [Armatimonas sp.]|uniref:ATP-binding protein n=1 Tax=Armatimonas sp. TaxID=1872638 RepID=UPI00374CF4A2